MMNPVKSVRPFNFPLENITVMASSTSEAEKKLKEILNSKTKNND